MEFIKNKSLFPILILCIGGVLGAMYYEGVATERWGEMQSETLESFKAAVEQVMPMTVGVWEANESEDVLGIANEDIRRVAGAYGALARRYHGSYENPDIHLNITCGFSRNVGAHTPDVCFVGSGNEQVSSVEKFSIAYLVELPDPEDPAKTMTEDRIATFNTAVFRGWDPSGNSYDQRVFWGWKDAGEGWQAPRFPRMKWQPNEPICKMYVSILESKGVDTLKAVETFLQDFLPTVDPLLNGKYRGLNSVMGETSDAGETSEADETADGGEAASVEKAAEGAVDGDLSAVPELDLSVEEDADAENEADVSGAAPGLEEEDGVDGDLDLGLPAGTLETEKDAENSAGSVSEKEEEVDEFTL